jgi:hypothetical protein
MKRKKKFQRRFRKGPDKAKRIGWQASVSFLEVL